LEIAENLRLDPDLEQEAGNVRPGSLHGGRTAAAMRQISDSLPGGGAGAYGQGTGGPSVRQPSPGEAPKRLI
jgi:hypothetical protein